MSHTSEQANASPGFDTSRPVGGFIEVVRSALIQPALFFTRLRQSSEGSELIESGAIWRQIAFAIVCGYISAPFGFLSALLLTRLIGLQTFNPLGFLIEMEWYLTLLLVLIFVVLLSLLTALSLYISVAIQHVLVWIFVRQGRRGYYATFPVITYASALSLISWIPLLGPVISLYAIYIIAVGIKEMHDTTMTRALLATAPIYLIGFANAVVQYAQAL